MPLYLGARESERSNEYRSCPSILGRVNLNARTDRVQIERSVDRLNGYRAPLSWGAQNLVRIEGAQNLNARTSGRSGGGRVNLNEVWTVMAGEHMARSLKAILALDTVGYSRLMAAEAVSRKWWKFEDGVISG